MHIAGKVFVVTGAGNGIGREVARQLLAGGAHVAGGDLSADGLAETGRIADAGDRFSAHVVDITDRPSVDDLRSAAIAAHGPIDGLVNVAGIIQRFVKVIDLPYEDIDKVMAVNFWGVVHMCKAFLPDLVERPEASLVNVASMGAYVPVPGQAAYGASKAAVMLLTEALYAELLDTNVTVTAIYPGAIDTGIAEHSGVELAADAVASDHKMTSPADAGAAIVKAIEKGRYRATIGSDAALMDKLSRLSPKFASRLIARQMKELLD
ncbi:SDR family NAD(P)-dependent oxidoreductase [Gordonia sp. NPDC003424]